MATAKPKPLTLEAFKAANALMQPDCTLSGFLKTLSKDDAATVKAAVMDRTIQASAVIRVLKPLGYQYGDQVIGRHRRNGCKICGIVAP